MTHADFEPMPRCSTAVVKVASRCNLDCSYCYVYNAGDDSHLSQPAVMSDATIDATVRRVAEHCATHALPTFTFAFHGGEPLLAKQRFFVRFVERALAAVPPPTRLQFRLQTNGVLLTAAWCRLFQELGIGIGISLDGPKSVNDRHRVDHAGRGSYDRIRAGWDMAVAHGLAPGMLTVVDPDISPRDVIQHLRGMAPRLVDFLLPDATHDKPPRRPVRADAAADAPYGRWLAELFDLWIADGAPFRIRLFEDIIAAILGGAARSDAMGPGYNSVLVIETDGAIEPVDVLKVCRNGITKTVFNVHSHSLQVAFGDSLISTYFRSNEALCDTCVACPVRTVCGGGYLPHRYRADNGFDNPSVYCEDLRRLICRIQAWVLDILPADIVASSGVVQLTGGPRPAEAAPWTVERCE